MKKFTKITAALVATTMMMSSFTACSSKSGTKKKDKDDEKKEKKLTISEKFENALDEIGYEHVESDKDIEDKMDKALENGYYISTTKKNDIESFCDSFDFFDADDCKSLVAGMKMLDGSSEFIVLSIEFEDEDTAEDFLDDMKDEFSDQGEVYEGFDGIDYADDEDDNYFKMAIKSDDYDMEMYIDIVKDGKTVYVVMLMASGDDTRKELVGDMNKFYKEIKEDSPASLL